MDEDWSDMSKEMYVINTLRTFIYHVCLQANGCDFKNIAMAISRGKLNIEEAFDEWLREGNYLLNSYEKIKECFDYKQLMKYKYILEKRG